MHADFYDIIVIGAGPAGMASALAAAQKVPHSKVALIEREEVIGGILKQCIHDGFGLIRFKERLTGPEYAWRYREWVESQKNIEVFVSTFVTQIRRIEQEHEETEGRFELFFTNADRGAFSLRCKVLVCATGCRERTDRQVFIHGDRPSGIFTAGQAQAFINLKGYLPGKNFVILGSGDIGLIMARRLTLESFESGGKVEGVYEVKSEPSGLTRNIVQCLEDYGIPLHLSTTVIDLHGKERLEGVTVAQVNAKMNPIKGTERTIPCDTLILSVGLIPENDILDELQPEMDPRTKGPKVNQFMQSSIPALFSCGNALHVNDLVDYVSESGEIAGSCAASLLSSSIQTDSNHTRIPLYCDQTLLYHVPAYIEKVVDAKREEENPEEEKAICFFRSSQNREKVKLLLYAFSEIPPNGSFSKKEGKVIYQKPYPFLKPPEMERIELKLSLIPEGTKAILFILEEKA